MQRVKSETLLNAHHSETVEFEARKRSICSRLMLTHCWSFRLDDWLSRRSSQTSMFRNIEIAFVKKRLTKHKRDPGDHEGNRGARPHRLSRPALAVPAFGMACQARQRRHRDAVAERIVCKSYTIHIEGEELMRKRMVGIK